MSEVYLYDTLNPEANAMLQALYSRSAQSVKKHVEKIEETGSSKFMESYYVGYGHESIGDCATTTLFFEDVSILAAKAIQDNQLYRGQETSTRYIDFTNRRIVNPFGEDVHPLQKMMMDFYKNNIKTVQDFYISEFPYDGTVSEKVWRNTINARAFDVMRAFIPAGTTTQLSWTTDFHQGYDNIVRLKHHPCKEMNAIADDALFLLKNEYKSSFSHKDRFERDAYMHKFSEKTTYSVPEFLSEEFYDTVVYETNIDNGIINIAERDVIRERPKGVKLPKYLKKYGNVDLRFILDFGSFRDIQRHRGGECQMPLLTTKYGFNQWYIDNLPNSVRDEAIALIKEFENEFAKLGSFRSVDMQYLIPMGYNVVVELSYSLPQLAYVAELRSSQTVHPTLRRVAKDMGKIIETLFPEMALYVDYDDDLFTLKRGTQNIELI